MVLLHPGALAALVLLAPLALVEWRRIRRERRAARAVGLEPQRVWRAAERAVCAGIVVALAVFAASEPSLRQATKVKLRVDAEAYLYVDSSGSMLAGASPSAPTRLQQARIAAARFAQELPPDLPLGAGALPESPLPLTMPIGDRQLFIAAIDRMTTPGSLPELYYDGKTATDFANLSYLTSARFFRKQTVRKIVIILTDAEGPAFDSTAIAAALEKAHIKLLVVRFGSSRDRIWQRAQNGTPVANSKFVSDLSDLGELRLLASETGGAFYGQSQVGAAIGKVNRLAGHGPDRPAQRLSLYAYSLGPYAVLAALPFLAWLAGGLLPLTSPLGVPERLRRRRSARRQRDVVAVSNQA
jgi:hypothetical protein